MNDGRMSIIVRTIATSIFPFVLIFSLYVIMHGHLTPGGGFQGGAIAASAIVMMIAAYGHERMKTKISENGLAMAESIGATIFAIIAFIGVVMAASFMYNFLVGTPLFGEIPPFGSNSGILNSGGVLPLLNIAVGMKVIGGLAAVVMIMALAGDKK